MRPVVYSRLSFYAFYAITEARTGFKNSRKTSRRENRKYEFSTVAFLSAWSELLSVAFSSDISQSCTTSEKIDKKHTFPVSKKKKNRRHNLLCRRRMQKTFSVSWGILCGLTPQTGNFVQQFTCLTHVSSPVATRSRGESPFSFERAQKKANGAGIR